jgi:iron complex transport system substrate-binding protein
LRFAALASPRIPLYIEEGEFEDELMMKFLPLLCVLIINAVRAQIALTDDVQRRVVLPKPAERIVSLAPSITETLFAIGAGDRIVGVTDYCNYPAQARTKPRVGGMINPNIETIVGLKPDLILLSVEGNVREDFAKLTSFGIPVFVTNPRDLNGIYRSIEQLGRLTGETDRALRLVQSLRAREETVAKSIVTRRTVLVFVSLQPIIVVGGKNFLAELIERAGGINLATNSGAPYPTFSREAVLKDNPDVLIFLSDIIATPADVVKLYPEWSKLTAFRERRMFSVEADLVSRPGPRALQGLESLSSIINNTHP